MPALVVRCPRTMCCLLGLLLWAIPGMAQVTADSTRRRTDTTRAAGAALMADSLRPPVSPGRAFLTSLMVPGLGQSRLGRQLPGAIYATVEVMSVVMLLKARNDLRIARAQAAASIVNQYRVDPSTGAPILDAGGIPIPQDTVPNRFDVERVEARRTQVEDWIAVLAFNHLFAGADAFVAALLWDLPARVGVQRLARGFGIGLSVRW
jgi:hypothetical protein